MKKYILLGLLICNCISINAQTKGIMTDPRDGQTYKTIKIENVIPGIHMTWMAENINYNLEGSKSYGKTEKFHDRLGMLYTRDMARQVCPVGWHLPSNLEWVLMENAAGGGSNAGNHLKSNLGWYNLGMGVNSSGFSGMAAGYRASGGKLEGLGMVGQWWSATISDEGHNTGFLLSYDNAAVSLIHVENGYYLSCRCVKD